MVTWAVQAIVSLVVVTGVLAYAARRVGDPREVAVWAQAHGLALTPGNVGLVRYFVRLVVVLRVVGGLGGWAVGASLDQTLAWSTMRVGGGWVWFLAGWMLGAWWADRGVAVAPGPGEAALLAPRRLADYLPRYLRLAPALGAVVAVGLAGSGLVSTATGVTPNRRGLVALAGAAVGVAALAWVAQRSVVARRQPAHAPDLVAADDAVRANAVHHLGGGATAVTLLLASELVGRPELGWRIEAQGPLSLLAVGSALVAWRFLAFRGWRVRRPVVGATTVAAAP